MKQCPKICSTIYWDLIVCCWNMLQSFLLREQLGLCVLQKEFGISMCTHCNTSSFQIFKQMWWCTVHREYRRRQTPEIVNFCCVLNASLKNTDFVVLCFSLSLNLPVQALNALKEYGNGAPRIFLSLVIGNECLASRSSGHFVPCYLLIHSLKLQRHSGS